MKAVILAGGEGTRLKPLTYRRPKPLIPIAGRPCIDYVIRSLVSAGFRELVIATAYLSDRLIQTIGDGEGYNASILYSFERTPAGTAGAVKRVANFIDATFVVAMGDVLADVDFRALYDFHRDRGAVATIALTEVQDPSQYGVAALDDRGRVTKFKEKPRANEVFSHLANAGIYVLEPEALDVVAVGEAVDFARDVFPKLLAKGLPVYGRELEGVWVDIGRPRDLWRASMEVVRREGRELTIPGVTTRGPLVVDPGTRIAAGVALRGPAFIAAGVDVGEACVIENSCIYEDARLETGAHVVNSIVLEQSRVGPRSEVRDSVIAPNCTVEEDVRIVGSIVGDEITIKAHSRLENANVSPPQ